MGGRGSCLAYKHINANDNNPNHVVDWDDPESEFQNKMFKQLKENNVSTRKSTDDIDDKVFERQQKQVLELASKYKKVLSTTTQSEDIQLGSEVIEGATLGYCCFSEQNGQVKQRIVLDKNLYTNYDKITRTVNSAVNNRQFVPINKMFKSRDYIVTHEMGHAIENGIVTKIAKERGMNIYTDFANVNRRVQAEIKNEVLKIYQKDFANGEGFDKIFLSTYSRKNDAEWFAETFTNLQLADKPEPVALALQQYLRRYDK